MEQNIAKHIFIVFSFFFQLEKLKNLKTCKYGVLQRKLAKQLKNSVFRFLGFAKKKTNTLKNLKT